MVFAGCRSMLQLDFFLPLVAALCWVRPLTTGTFRQNVFVVPGVINVSCLFVWVVVTVDDATDLLVSGVFSAIFVTMCVHSNLCGLLARHALFS